jgi:hypothetical protein
MCIPRNRSAEFNSFLKSKPGEVADREKQFEAGTEFSERA